MKIKSALIALALVISGAFVAPAATASEKPVLVSFKFTPNDIDILGAVTTVDFELVVSHPSGIETTNTLLTLTSPKNDTLGAYLTRTDSPVNPTLTKVTFKGSLVVPRGIATGVYTVTASGVKNNSAAGYQYDSGTLEAGTVRTLVGAESGLIIRSNGELNLDHKTFIGPSFDRTVARTFVNADKYRNQADPIWKVGESLDPALYYELAVPTLKLQIASSTPETCTSDGLKLKFVGMGNCAFAVSTAKTKDYAAYSLSYSTTITAARIKPTLVINKIDDQTTENLPKSVKTTAVYAAMGEYVFPVSTTPSVCYVTDFYVHILAGGKCSLNYQTAANGTFLASDIYTVSFEVLKDGKPVVAPTPTKPQANKKTISCVKKGKTTKKVTGVNPKCPKGYTLKKK